MQCGKRLHKQDVATQLDIKQWYVPKSSDNLRHGPEGGRPMNDVKLANPIDDCNVTRFRLEVVEAEGRLESPCSPVRTTDTTVECIYGDLNDSIKHISMLSF